MMDCETEFIDSLKSVVNYVPHFESDYSLGFVDARPEGIIHHLMLLQFSSASIERRYTRYVLTARLAIASSIFYHKFIWFVIWSRTEMKALIFESGQLCTSEVDPIYLPPFWTLRHFL